MRSPVTGVAATSRSINRLYDRAAKIILLFALVSTLPGCFQHYFGTQTKTHVDEAMIDSLKSENKYFVIHGQDRISGISSVTASNNTLRGVLVALPPEHSKHIDVKEHSTDNVVRRRDERSTLSEVHLYTSAKIDSVAQLSLPLFAINQVDVYEFNAKATKSHNVVSWAGIVVGAALAAATIILINFDAP